MTLMDGVVLVVGLLCPIFAVVAVVLIARSPRRGDTVDITGNPLIPLFLWLSVIALDAFLLLTNPILGVPLAVILVLVGAYQAWRKSGRSAE